jgi:hypothetical protein
MIPRIANTEDLQDRLNKYFIPYPPQKKISNFVQIKKKENVQKRANKLIITFVPICLYQHFFLHHV